MNSYYYLLKFIIVGEQNVGKSCLLLQFVDRRFREDHDPTIGVEFASRNMKVKERNIRLQIWDTAGQESFKSITRSYYRGSICALLVFDVSNRQSFEAINNWLHETKTYTNQATQLFLVGNKVDLVKERTVGCEEAQIFADQHGLEYFETSAVTGYNVENVFYHCTVKIMEMIDGQQIDDNLESIGVRVGGQKQSIEINQRKIQLAENKHKQKQIKRCCK